MNKTKLFTIALVLASLLLLGCVQQQNDSNNVGSGLMTLDTNKGDSNSGANIYNNLDTLQAKVKIGDNVKVNYTGRLTNGTIFDSSVDKEPLAFEVGAHQMISGFDNAVVGMKVGETKTVELPPEQAYGEYDTNDVRTINSTSFENFSSLEIGMTVVANSAWKGRVIELNDTNAVIDFNVYSASGILLSGKTLIFEITLVSIN
ncbi:MAG: peptidylprolyl isomerase [archaeon]